MPSRDLVAAAKEIRARAHAPYSNYLVGAAVLGASGRIFVGCNVENASFGATLCAERAAVAAMVAAGDLRLQAVAVYSEGDPPANPCGICRQVLAEFADDAEIFVASPLGITNTTLRALLPERFALQKRISP